MASRHETDWGNLVQACALDPVPAGRWHRLTRRARVVRALRIGSVFPFLGLLGGMMLALTVDSASGWRLALAVSMLGPVMSFGWFVKDSRRLSLMGRKPALVFQNDGDWVVVSSRGVYAIGHVWRLARYALVGLPEERGIAVVSVVHHRHAQSLTSTRNLIEWPGTFSRKLCRRLNDFVGGQGAALPIQAHVPEDYRRF